MKLIGFRTAKPRKFSYKPLYYDPVKEEQEKLKERFDNTSEGIQDSELRMRIRLRMNRKKLDERIRKRSRMMSILFTLLLLLMILYYIFIK
jgi:E3 ubiquitin-protein ligase DOA10